VKKGGSWKSLICGSTGSPRTEKNNDFKITTVRPEPFGKLRRRALSKGVLDFSARGKE
jgi:hypothetical protein